MLFSFCPSTLTLKLTLFGLFSFSVSARTECGIGIVVRWFNLASFFEGGPRRMADSIFRKQPIPLGFPKIYISSIPFC